MKKVFYLLAILILLFSSNSFAATDATAASKEKLEVHKTPMQPVCISVAVISNKNVVNCSMAKKDHFNVAKDTYFKDSYINEFKKGMQNYENELLGNFNFTESGPINLAVSDLLKLNKKPAPILTTKKRIDSKNWFADYYKRNHKNI
jgi:hypothetical protein